MSEKIFVVSNANALVSINMPDLRLRRTWSKKGAKVAIEKDILEEALYDPGVEYMFQKGILYPEKLEDRIALGLEPEGATQAENIIILSDKEKAEWMSPKKQGWELKEMLQKLTYEGKKDFCQFVIDNEILDGKKATIIKEVCGVDVIKGIQAKQSNET